MVKDHSDSERRNPLPPHGLLFPIKSKGSFICTIIIKNIFTIIITIIKRTQTSLQQSYCIGLEKQKSIII